MANDIYLQKKRALIEKGSVKLPTGTIFGPGNDQEAPRDAMDDWMDKVVPSPYNSFGKWSQDEELDDDQSDLVRRIKGHIQGHIAQRSKGSGQMDVPRAKTDAEMIGAHTARDVILAKSLGHKASAFEHTFKVSTLALLIDKTATPLSLTQHAQIQWAIESGASIHLLQNERPNCVFELMLQSKNFPLAKQLLHAGFKMPQTLLFNGVVGSTGLQKNITGTPLHALFSNDNIQSKTLLEAAHVLADIYPLHARDSVGFTVCGRLNVQMSTMHLSEDTKKTVLDVFAFLVSQGADPSDLSQGALTVAADPRIAKAAEIELERKAIEQASRKRDVSPTKTRI